MFNFHVVKQHCFRRQFLPTNFARHSPLIASSFLARCPPMYRRQVPIHCTLPSGRVIAEFTGKRPVFVLPNSTVCHSSFGRVVTLVVRSQFFEAVKFNVAYLTPD